MEDWGWQSHETTTVCESFDAESDIRRLSLGIILQAVMDFCLPPSAANRKIIMEAQEWLMRPNMDFVERCGAARLAPSKVRERALRLAAITRKTGKSPFGLRGKRRPLGQYFVVPSPAAACGRCSTRKETSGQTDGAPGIAPTTGFIPPSLPSAA